MGHEGEMLRGACRFGGGASGRFWAHHRPHVVGHRLANHATHENHIRDSEHDTTTNVVVQGARLKRAKKSTERRGGSDQFLWGSSRREPYYLSTARSQN